MKRLFCAALATAFFALSTPVDSSAQGDMFLGGGATIPVSDYGEIAKTGWQAWWGFLVPVSDGGISWGIEGFYGKNSHETDGDKTTVLGGLALVGWEGGDPEGLQPTVFGGVGVMNRKFTTLSVTGPGSTSFAWSGGAGVGFPLGGVKGFAGGTYTSGTGDDNSGTRFVALGVSVIIPIG